MYVTDETYVTMTGRTGSVSFFDEYFNFDFNTAENGRAIATDNGDCSFGGNYVLCRNSTTFGTNILIGENRTVTCDRVEFEELLAIHGTSVICESSVVLTEDTLCDQRTGAFLPPLRLKVKERDFGFRMAKGFTKERV